MATSIEVYDISKKYLIRHQQGVQYQTLRDVLVGSAKSIIRKARHPLEKNPARFLEEEFWALKNLSFSIREGERVGIIGRNGAGKSTLLKILSRITDPTYGSIKLRGRVASLLEVGTGFHPELTGRENIFLNGAILGMSKKEIYRKFDEIVSFAEVEKFIDTPVKRYSSGMYIRLAFSVAAHLDSDILIVDEVLGVGDIQFQKKCMNHMESITGTGRTVLFVSHNMGVVSSLCNRGIFLKSGEVYFDGDVQSAIDLYSSEGGQISAEAIFLPTKTSPVEITRIVIENANSTGIYELGQDLVFCVQYVVHQDTGNVTIAAQFDRDGTPIYYTYDVDMSPELTEKRVAGCYEAKFLLPSSCFKEGSYLAAFKIGAGFEDISKKGTALQFSIETTQIDTKHLSYRRERPGVIYRPTKWETVRHV